MKLVRISKMSPDPSAVHVLGNGRVARRLRKKVSKAKLPKKPKIVQPSLFDDPENYLARMKVTASQSAANRAKAAKRRQEAFRKFQP